MYLNENATLVAQVQSELHRHAQLSDSNIVVSSEDGVITLRGTVRTEIQREAAEGYAKNVPGVFSVKNELRAENDDSQSVSEYIDDAFITTKVKAKLLAESNLPAVSISVKTNDGTVTLSGETETSAQALLAEQIANRTEGVRQVHNLIRPTHNV